MILLLKAKASKREKELLAGELLKLGVVFRKETLRDREAVVLESYPKDIGSGNFGRFPCVEKVIVPAKGYFLASAEYRQPWKKLHVGGRRQWKNGELLIAAGP